MSLGHDGLHCSSVFMVVSTIDPGLQELHWFWDDVVDLSHKKCEFNYHESQSIKNTGVKIVLCYYLINKVFYSEIHIYMV